MLSSYAAAVHRQTVPYPHPVYQEAENVEPPQSSSAVGATDFQLLRLAADDLDMQHSNVGLAELIRPAGRFPPLAVSGQHSSRIHSIHNFAVVRMRALVRFCEG